MTEQKAHDIAIIGAGPGGYVAAIRAAQLGKSVALIDKGFLGGCCLNIGCIPTKTLVSYAKVLQTVKRSRQFGLHIDSFSFHYEEMVQKKDHVLSKIRASLEGLLKANKISIYRGEATFVSPYELKVQGQDSLYIRAEKIIIATGSIPLDVKAFPCDHKRILNSTSLLALKELPQSLVIIGGGYIGCEFASLFAELGVKVTIIEALPTILSAQGEQISQFMTKSFQAHGIELRTNVKVKTVTAHDLHVVITLENNETLTASYALVSVGRKICTEELSLDKAGLLVNDRGAIPVNTKMETATRGIYAIGDVTGSWMLAHVASHQALIAASNAAGKEAFIHYDAVPSVVFTSPEIATVGMTPEGAKAKGFSVMVGAYPFQALGKAQASLETEGFAQIVADRATGQILGAQVIGHDASNLIAEMTLAVQHELTLESMMETIHAHPTMAEAWLESAFLANETPIHFPPKIKKL